LPEHVGRWRGSLLLETSLLVFSPSAMFVPHISVCIGGGEGSIVFLRAPGSTNKFYFDGISDTEAIDQVVVHNATAAYAIDNGGSYEVETARLKFG